MNVDVTDVQYARQLGNMRWRLRGEGFTDADAVQIICAMIRSGVTFSG